MDSLRLFAAVLPGDELLEGITAFQYTAAKTIPSSLVKWIPRDNLHVTLQFLGDTPEDRVPDVLAAMKRAAGGVGIATADGRSRGLTLATTAAGAFPTLRRPRVLWLGLSGDTAALADVNTALRHELAELDLRYDPKTFRPHITIAYVRKGRKPKELGVIGELLPEVQPPRCSMQVDAIHLVASDLRPDGAHYRTVGSVAL